MLCVSFLLFIPFTLQETTYLYKMRRKERSKNCGSCSYPPTQSNSFLGICFTKPLIKLKGSLNIYSWGYLGGPPTSSWLGNPNIQKYHILKILEMKFLFIQIWYRNIQNWYQNIRYHTCSPHHNFQTIMNLENLFHI